MAPRRSIRVDGFNHGPQPIPAACRIGPMVMTGGIHGMDPTTGALPDDPAEQVRHVFLNLLRIMEAAGAKPDDILKLTFYVKDRALSATINEHWLRIFPDETARPARHTFQTDTLAGAMAVQCDATAYVEDR